MFLKSNSSIKTGYNEWLNSIGVSDEEDFIRKHYGKTDLKLVCTREHNSFKVKLTECEMVLIILVDYPFYTLSSLMQKKDDLYMFGSFVSAFFNKLNCSQEYDFKEYFYNEYVRLMRQYNN